LGHGAQHIVLDGTHIVLSLDIIGWYNIRKVQVACQTKRRKHSTKTRCIFLSTATKQSL